MIAKEANFLRFLQGTKQFIIPLYQRTYSWTLEQCEQLWNDILRAASDDRIKGHFVGSIVYIERGLYQVSSVQQLLVIDGQQRLTTLSLLLAALGKALQEQKIEGEISRRKINNYYLFNNEEQGELKYKLILTQSDKDTFTNVLENRDLPQSFSRRIEENYRFFETQIQRSGIDLFTLYQGLLKLFIVDIALDRSNDNPQLIFESLNSTGLDLSQADLIRNYVLMGLDLKEQERVYNDLWFPMERSFGQENYSEYFNRFMRDFLTIETGNIPKMEEVYAEFKSYVSSNKDVPIYDLIKKIHYYSKLYVKLAYGKEDDPEISEIIRDINELKVEVSYPFLLELFDDYSKKLLSKEDLIDIMKLVESYVFRRAICRIPTNSLNKTFARLSKEIDKNNYLESMMAAFILKESYTRFPLDDEFRTQFPAVPLYNLRLTDYTLRKLENFEHKKEPIVVRGFTVEHIMPQNKELSQSWIDELGDNWREVHQKYLHTIGNLTLTGYNSELSDSPFSEKRNMKGGFASSPLTLNRRLANLEHWNKNEIEKRAQELTDLAVKVWPAPSVPADILEQYKTKKDNHKLEARTEEDHLREHEEFRSLYYELRRQIIAVGNGDVRINSSPQDYISFAKRRTFCYLKFKINWIRLHIFVSSMEASTVTGFKPDGSKRVYFHIASPKDVEKVNGLLKMAYDRAS